MNIRGLVGGLNGVCQWITNLALLNVLWILFSLMGLILFGFFPSTTAMFTVVRKWVNREEHVPILNLFWNTFKKEFIKSNALGVILTAMGLLLFFDLRFFQSQDGTFFKFLTLAVLFLSSLYLVMLLYLFPVYVHYESKYLTYFKNALLIGISNPIRTLGLMVICLGGTIFFLRFSGLFFLFSGSTLSLITMKFAFHAFIKVEQKQFIHRKEECV